MKAKALRRCWRQVSITVNIVSTKRLPAASLLFQTTAFAKSRHDNAGTLRRLGKGRLGHRQNQTFLAFQAIIGRDTLSIVRYNSPQFDGFATAPIAEFETHGSFSQSLPGFALVTDDNSCSAKSPLFPRARHGHGLHDRRSVAGGKVRHLVGDFAGRRRSYRADAEASLPTRGEPYEEIRGREEDARARRITAYLNLLDRLVHRQVGRLAGVAIRAGQRDHPLL